MSWESRYSFKDVEEKVYQFWQDKKLFSPSGKSKKTFSIVLPPPNVTGSLHLGHALNHTIQDSLFRWKKMNGYDCVWFPGTDHAGIATQLQVEKHLAQKGESRKSLGRELFVKRVWEWKHKYSERIIHQMKRLGNSCDWSRHLFTLDEASVKAVKKCFCHLYKKGLIYKGLRLVNWSPGLSSAISDLEVDHREVKSYLWEINYPLLGKNESLVVSTTRPETLFADQALAVHPEDSRYKKYHGCKVKLPLTDRVIPVITDEYVDPKFGSGVLKITPAHDFNDYKIGKKHSLDFLNILTEEGVLNEYAKPYQGLNPEEARKRVSADLKERGFLAGIKPHTHQVGFCSRSGVVVEPFLSHQWFVKMDGLAERALDVVLKKELEFVPNSWLKIYKHWMMNIEDWCISRGLWWGHQIPAWECFICKKITVSEGTVLKCGHCSSSDIRQDENVLDTWFSSALWPMSVLGWPNNFKNNFYPTSVLVTAPDILFFWVARMIMMGLEFQNSVPFKSVYLHGVVRDNKGRKMSKTLGNGEDPIDLIENFGSDALRLSLLSSHAKGRDVRFSRKNLEVCRNFLNKIWNAGRFIHQTFPELEIGRLEDFLKSKKLERLSSIDQWILQKLKKAEKSIQKDLSDYRFSSACMKAYHFSWLEFCDWYLEWLRSLLYGKSVLEKKDFAWELSKDSEQPKVTGEMAFYIYNQVLKLLHPFIPFITEEIYHKMREGQISILEENYLSLESHSSSKTFEESYKNVEWIKHIISVIRQIRGENNIPPNISISVQIKVASLEDLKFIKDKVKEHLPVILFLARLNKLELTHKKNENSLTASMPLDSEVSFGKEASIVVFLEGLTSTENEKKRLKKKIDKLEKELNLLEIQLSSDNFLSKAPKNIVEEKKLKAKEAKKLMNNLKNSFEKMNK